MNLAADFKYIVAQEVTSLSVSKIVQVDKGWKPIQHQIILVLDQGEKHVHSMCYPNV